MVVPCEGLHLASGSWCGGDATTSTQRTTPRTPNRILRSTLYLVWYRSSVDGMCTGMPRYLVQQYTVPTTEDEQQYCDTDEKCRQMIEYVASNRESRVGNTHDLGSTGGEGNYIWGGGCGGGGGIRRISMCY